MNARILEWLACPRCGANLRLQSKTTSGEEIENGTLTCERCGKDYPIVRGIPRFVEPENYAGTFGHQWNKFAQLQLDSKNGTHFSRERFFSITEWDPAELNGKLILDVGCGAGRFSEVALSMGAEVVSMDLSSAVEACRLNLAPNPKLHVLQGSIYEFPLKRAIFDFVYCIGVIQHTPDPRRSIDEILKMVRPGGKAGLWIYELNWKSFVGTAGFKYFLRPLTKRMAISQLEFWCNRIEKWCRPFNLWARKRGAIGKVIMRMLPAAAAHLHGIPLSDDDFCEWVRLDTFDMYSPAHDHPQRFNDVKLWMADAGFTVDPRHPHGAVSITGTRLS